MITPRTITVNGIAVAMASHVPVVVVGAGPVGLAAAIDLAQQGVAVVLLDAGETLATGSRAICFAKRTLEIFDRLGCGEAVVQKGVGWHTGKVFFRSDLVFAFDLLGETGHHRPAFVNIQQYHVEARLAERARALPNLDLRWRHRVIGVAQDDSGVTVTIEGGATLRCDWLVAADGARSSLRGMLGQESRGQTFRDRFLIADVRMTAPFPAERWFWFDPPFHPGQSVLLHRQPDDLWRIDFQLGWDADPVAERAPARVIPRVRALLGPEVDFALEWVSVYTFSCLRMARFRHGRVLFAGDAAHGVSPFGARGANSGVQDADNLAWKLRMVVAGSAPPALLDSYASEREFAADDNIRHSTRSTDFITPKNAASRAFRDAVLSLARDCPFARPLVNSGRLSTPTTLSASPLNTPDEDEFAGAMVPGAAAADAPFADGWLLDHIAGGFTLLWFDDGGAPPDLGAMPDLGLRLLTVPRAGHAVLARRFDARPGTAYLLRPDQHVAARWRRCDPDKLRAALARATAAGGQGAEPGTEHRRAR